MQHYQQLINHLSSRGPLGVAFSGGVDSTLLAKAAHDALGDRAIAITIHGPMQLRGELQAARELAKQIGIRQIELRLDWSELPELHTNPPDRCYRCKSSIITLCLRQLASLSDAGHSWSLVDGSNLDDLQAHRPGRRALQELAVGSPLAELGFSKAHIRSVSRQLGLPGWDRPAQSCLLTRFLHDSPITDAELRRVESCEEELHSMGCRLVRARCLGDGVRLELGQQELAAVTANPLLQKAIEEVFAKAGFSGVVIDSSGYRSGSLD
ncbi:MAG: ATP-dependent sacrificial sulfur transferase LarE [Geobacter sp.]